MAGELYHPVSPAAMLRTKVGAATFAVPRAALHAEVGATAPSGKVAPASVRGAPDEEPPTSLARPQPRASAISAETPLHPCMSRSVPLAKSPVSVCGAPDLVYPLAP